jgi:hypothetical protein
MQKWKYGHLERALLQAMGNERERNPISGVGKSQFMELSSRSS